MNRGCVFLSSTYEVMLNIYIYIYIEFIYQLNCFGSAIVHCILAVCGSIRINITNKISITISSI